MKRSSDGNLPYPKKRALNFAEEVKGIETKIFGVHNLTDDAVSEILKDASIPALVIAADSAKKKQRLKEVVILCKRILEIDANFIDAHFRMGRALMQMSAHIQSRKCFEQVIELSECPTRTLFKTHFFLAGMFFNNIKSTELCLYHCKEALKTPFDFNTGSIYDMMAHVYDDLKEEKLALHAYQNLVDHALPGDPCVPYETYQYALWMVNRERYDEIQNVMKSGAVALINTHKDAFINWNLLTEFHKFQFERQHPDAVANLEFCSEAQRWILQTILGTIFEDEIIQELHQFLYKI